MADRFTWYDVPGNAVVVIVTCVGEPPDTEKVNVGFAIVLDGTRAIALLPVP